jgi:hypothetical protein
VYEALDRDDSVANSFPDFSASSSAENPPLAKNAFLFAKPHSGFNFIIG